jgi:hypothetical protein
VDAREGNGEHYAAEEYRLKSADVMMRQRAMPSSRHAHVHINSGNSESISRELERISVACFQTVHGNSTSAFVGFSSTSSSQSQALVQHIAI